MTVRFIWITATVLAAILHPAVLTAQPLASVPTDLPDPDRSLLLARSDDLRSTSAKISAAREAFNRKCATVLSTEAAFSVCVREKSEIEAGIVQMKELRGAFNLDVEAATRRARIATTLTFTNVKITGEVHFQDKNGVEISQGDLAELKIPPGTRIVTGPGGALRADVPGGHSFHLGGGAELTIDEVFINPNGLQKLDVDLKHGFFRWAKPEEKKAAPIEDSKRFRIRTPHIAVAVRGTDVEFLFESDGSGSVKLYSGEVLISSIDGAKSISLKAGDVVTVSKSGILSLPKKFNTNRPSKTSSE